MTLEAEMHAKEKKTRDKVSYLKWVAGGAPGSQDHHHTGDEHKGKRKKAADDSSTDQSSDEEFKIDHSARAVKKAHSH